jgi:hypothetical protein
MEAMMVWGSGGVKHHTFILCTICRKVARYVTQPLCHCQYPLNRRLDGPTTVNKFKITGTGKRLLGLLAIGYFRQAPVIEVTIYD